MKIVMVLMAIGILHVHAAGYAQNITLSEKNAPLEKVINEIRTQSGYDFLGDTKLIRTAKPVNIDVKDAYIEEVLRICFANQNLTYAVENKIVVIREKEKSILDATLNTVKNLFYQDSLIFKGRVLDPFGQPMSGASVKVKGGKKSTFTTKEGNFAIFADANATLQISYIGYETQELKLRREDAGLLRTFNMKPEAQNLGEVAIISDGYQNLPKERSTGSYEVITNKQLNMVAGINILKRLEGNATDLDFNNQGYATSSSNPVIKKGVLAGLTIRGTNTIYGTSASGNRVLVVVDGVVLEDNGSQYTEDQISKINPNDVEKITILKDAVAASVYGSKAANGVILITTKKPKFNQPIEVSFNANTTITQKPDLFYTKRASVQDFIDFQDTLYTKGYYNYRLRTPGSSELPEPVPLAVEIFNKRDKGQVSAAEAKAQLAALAQNDVRRDLTKYVLRNASLQSYSASVSSGSEKMAYRVSAGYDKSLNNTVKSDNDRITLSTYTTYRPLKDLNISFGINYIKSSKNDQSVNGFLSEAGVNYLMPYDRLADDNGNPLNVIKLEGRGYRAGWVDTVGRGNLLDWHYSPLKDINNGYNKTRASDFQANLNADYKINDFLSVNAVYSYQNAISNISNLDNVDSYFTRNILNTYTSGYNSPTPWVPGIPIGDIYMATSDNFNAQNIRGQFNFNKTFGGKHNIAGIVGGMLSKVTSLTRTDSYLGYSDRFHTFNRALNYSGTGVPVYVGGTGQIPLYGDGIDDNNINSTKVYANAIYTYDNRYSVSGSIAKDQYNLFGADRNKSFKPYWSTGLRWNINNEKFYHVPLLPVLAVRATYGYNGTLNYSYSPKSYISSRLTDGYTGFEQAYLNGSTNLQLRPEKTGQLNLALDFGFKNNRLSGTIEYYDKRNKDLISQNAIDPTTGIAAAQFNTADTHGKGVSLSLNSINLQLGDFSWASNFYFSSNQIKITKLYLPKSTAFGAILSGGSVKRAGDDVNGLYAIQWGGLDPKTGKPMVMVGGKPTSNLFPFLFGSSDSLRYVGTTSPKYYGAFRNTFNYKSLSLSFNILYKLGYYFRRQFGPSLMNYQAALSSSQLLPAEYGNRWKKPGDELTTNIPAFIYPVDTFSGSIYQYADINVVKGDHIRLQDITLSYSFKKQVSVLKNASLQASVQNLGILWRANKYGIDPDVADLPQPKIFSIGFRTNF